MLDLALHYGHRPVPVADIVARQGAPEAYLDQIAALLRPAGLVVSRRGPQGGHTLATTPAHITVARALVATQGAAPLATDEERPPGGTATGRMVSQGWREAQAAAGSVRAAITLADLAARNR